MRILYTIIISFFLLTSCGTSKQISHNNSIFSAEEKAFILNEDIDEPMRVLQINIPKDSIVLRSKSQSFTVNPDDTVLNHLIQRMLVTLKKNRGVGIAAPQVGILKEIIWVQRLDKENEPFEVYYNPEIKQYSKLKQDVPEGCLSVPDFKATTQDRSYAIFLTYIDRVGHNKCEMVEAFTAAIFQHEIDHLNGIMFLDHLSKEKKESFYHKIE